MLRHLALEAPEGLCGFESKGVRDVLSAREIAELHFAPNELILIEHFEGAC